MEQQHLLSSVERVTAQRGGTGNMEGGVKMRIPAGDIM